jgi:uncharacterized protein involved in exopolysaccharide biosynthesis
VGVEPLTLSELTARTARRWRTVLGGVLAGLLVGTVVHLTVPARYEAVAVLRVDAADPALVDMTAEEAVATSRRVTAESLDTLGDPDLTITEVEDAITATAVAESRLLRIAFTATRPREATRGADAVAQAYLAARAVDRGAGPRPSDVTGVVVDPARTPTAPVGPGRGTAGLGGGVLGLLVAVPVAARRAGSARLSRTTAGRAA